MEIFLSMVMGLSWVGCPQKVAQSVETTPNEVEVTSSNLPSPLLWTCKKKKKVGLRERDKWHNQSIDLNYKTLPMISY
jgi:hypothetical protein